MIAAMLFVSSSGALQQPDPKKDKDEKALTKEDERYRREAEQLMDGIDLEVLVAEKWIKVKRIEKPILYYGDATRENDRGSLWAWGDKGRPVATLELYQNTANRTQWAYAVCNLSGGKLRAKRNGESWWEPNDSTTELKDIPDAPAPAADGPQRQRQLKQLAQKFTGHEFWDPNNSRFELRRLERPLHTYKEDDRGIQEGALYILANGTNPELIVLIEARTKSKDGAKPTWQYGVGRSAHAELHLEYDGKEVFEAPRGYRVSGENKPYWLGTINTAPKK